ncbi:glycosyltransferase family 2 protein [Methylophaga lonarensis]|uniref:glycosyltransferase family 2 protein n=1 Tax=Methylophaga lonarensis TaxID=999151 RepID=UPI003D26B575
MKLSIIIVNWNVSELLKNCLHSVYAQSLLPAEQFEVFVVDNASADDSVEMVRTHFPQVHLVANEENVGFGRANDQVLSECQGEFVLLLNPDTVVIDHAIDKLLEHIQGMPDVAVMGCRLLNLDGSLQRWTGGAYPDLWNVARHYLFLDKLIPAKYRPASLYLNRDIQSDEDVDWISGAVMMLRKSALDGYIFNEKFFMYGEDMECCHRLKLKGWRIVYSPVCSVIHIQGASMKKQQGEILLSSLKGLRSFYSMLHDDKRTWLLDWITLSGFFIRWFSYSLLAIVKPGGPYAEKAKSSWKYIQITREIIRRAKLEQALSVQQTTTGKS